MFFNIIETDVHKKRMIPTFFGTIRNYFDLKRTLATPYLFSKRALNSATGTVFSSTLTDERIAL